MQQHYKSNTKYEILTPNGWEDFDGVIKNTNAKKPSKKILFEDDNVVIATDEHRFFVNGVETPVHALQVDMTLDGNNGNIVCIEPCVLEDTYEIFNTLNHKIIVNGIVSHQCDEFAFVKPHIAREFYDSVLPTISTGGHMKRSVVFVFSRLSVFRRPLAATKARRRSPGGTRR